MLPSGTVTFLFTDIEDSTKLWQEQPEAMAQAHALHDQILQEAINANHGYVFQIVGDSFSVAFHNALDGLNASLTAQRGLAIKQNNSPVKLKVRMGLHTGAAELQPDGKYEGYVTIASTQRIMSVAHGGQILLSHPTVDLLNNLPEGVSLRDLGEHQLKSLRAPLRLYQLVAPDLPQEFPPIQSLHQFLNNLPMQLTSFIGREKEIAEIKSALQSAKLVTLSGSGGTGKTRLSIEAGTQLLSNFANGVWLVELAPLSDESQIIPALAQVFSLQELPFNPLAKLVEDYLRDKRLLLILDNCEHLIAPCARLADHLLHQCAGLKILASSREALGIAGEVAYRIPSLADSESTQLFVDRAHATNSNFILTDGNASSVAQICHRLDGIPLAIELAAARTKLLSAEQIASRLDDLFRLLVGGSRTALPRQQTLRALIDWSYDLLSEEEKNLLRIASVFIGGWTLEALEFVANEPNTLELLEQLVNKSLVVTKENKGEMRYFLLETIRQYAREKLFEAKQASEARDRHFIYFDQRSEEMWDSFRALKGFVILRDQAYDEFENMRAAVEWGLEFHLEKVLHLVANFAIVSSWTGSTLEGLVWVNRAIEYFRKLPAFEGQTDLTRQALLSKALFAQGMVGMATGNVKSSRRSLDEAIALTQVTGDKRLRGYALQMYYTASQFEGRLEATEYVEEGFVIFNEIEDPWGMSMTLMNMARIALARGDRATSEKYFGLLKVKMKETPISFMSGMTFLGIGYSERFAGHLETAKQHFEEGLNIFKQLRHKGFENVMYSEIGHIARMQGDTSTAVKTYRETILHFQEMGNRSAVAHQLECFGFLAITAEEPQCAARLFGAADGLRKSIDSQMTEYERIEFDQAVARLRTMLPEFEFNALWEEGKSMTMEQAIQLALSQEYR